MGTSVAAPVSRCIVLPVLLAIAWKQDRIGLLVLAGRIDVLPLEKTVDQHQREQRYRVKRAS